MVKSPTANEFNKIFLSVSTASTECKLQVKVFLPVFLQANNVVVREPNQYLSWQTTKQKRYLAGPLISLMTEYTHQGNSVAAAPLC